LVQPKVETMIPIAMIVTPNPGKMTLSVAVRERDRPGACLNLIEGQRPPDTRRWRAG